VNALDAEVDVLINAKAKVARLGERLLPQLILLHLEPTLQDLHRLGTAHCAVHRDLLVTTDAERSHRVSCLGEHGCLSRQALEHLLKAIERVSSASEPTRVWIGACSCARVRGCAPTTGDLHACATEEAR
jgi:hypothetical protein